MLILCDFDGLGNYFVSECGRVFSKKRKKLVELSYWKTVDGYLRTKIYNKSIAVHRLVALTFIENPLNLETVDHIDNNKLNNHVSNLRWLSREDNAGRAGRGSYIFVSPDNLIVTITGLAEFCRNNSLTQANMSKVILGKRPHHKNWRLYDQS